MKKRMVVLSACCVLLMGCSVFGGGHRRGPTQEEMTEMMQAQMQMFQQQFENIRTAIGEWRDLGVVDAQVSPAGATLLIDGGQYLDQPDQIVVPVGTHEFKAVWPDGKEATQKVYVGPARVTMNFNYRFGHSGGSLRAAWDSKGSEVHKTVVQLQKPSE